MNPHWTDHLSAYLDGELPPAERSACERHLASCHECRGALDELGEVVAAARTDPDVLPGRDLWPAVLRKISTTRRPADVNGDVPYVSRTRKRIVVTLPQLALAASLLGAVAATVGYLAGQRPGADAGSTPAVRAEAEPEFQRIDSGGRARFADASFSRAVADLERVLQERRQYLDPRTRIVLERSLAEIDRAISEAEAALDRDPASIFLNSYVAEARHRKLELLRRAAQISLSGD